MCCLEKNNSERTDKGIHIALSQKNDKLVGDNMLSFEETIVNKTLILTINAHHASIYEATGKKIQKKLNSYTITDFEDEHARPERKGSYYQKQGSPSHFFDPHSDLKEVERDQFAADVLEKLGSYANGRDYKGYIIAAEPKMLGALRKKLNISHNHVKILKEISKDLTHMDEHTLPESLFEGVSFL